MLNSSDLKLWVELISYDKADKINLHEPYRNECKDLQLRVLTTIGLESHEEKGKVGLYTSLIHQSNSAFIRLDLQHSGISPRQHPGKPEGTGSTTLIDCRDRFFRQLCLQLSDVVYIAADNDHQATRELFRLVDAVEVNEKPHQEWPDIIILNKSGHGILPFNEAHRHREMFAEYALGTWGQLGRSGGRFTQILHKFLQKTQLCPGSTTTTTMWHEVQMMLTSRVHFRRGPQSLGEVTTNVERHCIDPPVPRAIEARGQYWPGMGHLTHSSLIHWFRRTEGTAEFNNRLAKTFAQLFLQDSEFVVPGKYHPLCRRMGLMVQLEGSETSYEELFLSFYRPICVKAWLAAARERGELLMEDLEPFLDRILSCMMTQSDSRKRKELHEDVRSSMKAITNTPFCCACLWDRKPLVFLSCGHGICERDVWMIASRTSKLDTLLILHTCPVCDHPVNQRYRLRPLQAGYRLATFDGGGVLGIVSLVALAHVLKPLPRGLHPYHYFDYMGGTSTGSINASALGLMKLPVDKCIDLFCEAARYIFVKEHGLLGRITTLARLVTKGAIYRSAPFHRVLQGLCGDMPVRGTGEESVPEVVLVVIAATDRLSRLVLLRSYAEVLYFNAQTENPKVLEGRYKLANAIAASCAAPSYFEPVDDLHDGALAGASNPSSVMSGELHKLSMLRVPHIDFAASFGTGSFVEERPKHWLQRLKLGLERALNASALYARYHMTLSVSERERSYRIDPFFERSPVSLDDADSVDRIKEQTQERLCAGGEPTGEGHGSNSQILDTIENLRVSLIATLFYGILLCPPYFDPRSRRYFAKLAISSRWEDIPSIKSELSELLNTSHFIIEQTRFPYNTPLELTVTMASLEQPLDIRLSYNERSHPISGFPLSISEMRYLQGPKSLFMDPATMKFDHSYSSSDSPPTSPKVSHLPRVKRCFPGEAQQSSKRRRTG